MLTGLPEKESTALYCLNVLVMDVSPAIASANYLQSINISCVLVFLFLIVVGRGRSMNCILTVLRYTLAMEAISEGDIRDVVL
jgi:hypothetical protein